MTLKRGTLDTIVTTNLHADAVIAASETKLIHTQA